MMGRSAAIAVMASRHTQQFEEWAAAEPRVRQQWRRYKVLRAELSKLRAQMEKLYFSSWESE